ncbi:MAG: HU family DNA-binding protein [Reichenbachiella sp.]
MPVSYKVVSKRPGGIAGKRTPKYFPIVTNRGVVDARELANRISQRTSFSEPDVMGMIESFIQLVPDILQEGKNVKLNDFGIFSLHISGVGQEDPSEVNVHTINKVKMSFLPSKLIKRQLSTTKFTKVK